MTTRDHWVYRTYDAEGICLYVGCTKDLAQRAETHRFSSDWYASMARAVIAGPYPKAVALRLEAEQIDDLQPRFNRRGVRSLVDAHPLVPNLPTTKAARLLGMSERRLLRLVHRGEIKAYNIGSEIQPRFVFATSYLKALAVDSTEVAA